MRYAGGKGVSFRRIVNLIPPHRTYIETHLGGGAVLRNKRQAELDIGIDIDPEVISTWKRIYGARYQIFHRDACDFLRSRTISGDEVIYSDPPYLPSTRRRSVVYRHDYTEKDHERLLETLTSLRCFVLISGYDSALYRYTLRNWNVITFTVGSHSGVRQENIWFNFEPPRQLHDPRFLGDSFRKREVIKRRIERLCRRMESLSSPERHQLLGWLQSRCDEEGAV